MGIPSKVNINHKTLTEFIKLCEKAEKLGLEFIKDKKGQYKFIIGGLDEIAVKVQKYDLTDWNGYHGGHTMLTVWTKTMANRLVGHIDASITDSNPERYTEVKKSPHTTTNTVDLKWFIKTHSKS